MNKGIIIAGIVVLILVGGGLFIANQQSQNSEQTKMAQEKAAMMQKDKTADGGKDEVMMGKGFLMKDGKMMVEEDGKMTTMTSDAALSDSTKVTTSGQVMKKDGTTMTLTEGQSIWMDGTFDDGKTKKTDDKMANKFRYVEYSKVALDQAATNRRVLFFYANWCPICKPADADFKANSSKIPVDVTVIRVNYNDTDTDQEEKDLAKKYGITYQHTFVQIDVQGKEVTKWNGGKTDELLANIK